MLMDPTGLLDNGGGGGDPTKQSNNCMLDEVTVTAYVPLVYKSAGNLPQTMGPHLPPGGVKGAVGNTGNPVSTSGVTGTTPNAAPVNTISPSEQGVNFTLSNTALDVGGGIYQGLKTTVTPGDQWLGKNGKYYNLSWGGNQHTGSRSGAIVASKSYKWAGRTTVAANVVLGGIQTYNGYQKDGGQFGYNANKAAAGAAGGVVGGWAGAEAGANSFGVFGALIGGPPGAIVGAVIGGFVGGITGSQIGSQAGEAGVNYYYSK